jgi:glycosyltransferase involved in cell wall biosynthesis
LELPVLSSVLPIWFRWQSITTSNRAILRNRDEIAIFKLVEAAREDVHRGRVLLKAEFIPDDETEVYFKVLPYRHVYQSGVLFLVHSFGLLALAADVGLLRDEIVEGKTGFVFRPDDPVDLARAIECYFASDLYATLDSRRQEIRDSAMERHS